MGTVTAGASEVRAPRSTPEKASSDTVSGSGRAAASSRAGSAPSAMATGIGSPLRTQPR